MKDARKLSAELNKIISAGLPGIKAHVKMLPEGRGLLSSSSNLKQSAVMLLLFPKMEEWNIVFIKRNTYDGPHSGQISFPGGKRDVIDASLLHTALRELFEETGVDVSADFVAGELTPLAIPVSGFIVHPYVAVLDHYPPFNPDRNEVEYLVEVELRAFAKSSTFKTTKMKIGNSSTLVPYFDVQNEMIWGATSMILSEFMVLYSSLTSD